MIQLEFIVNDEESTHHFADMALDLSRFQEIFEKVVKIQLSEKLLH